MVKTGKEAATFLGFAGYYRTFIPQYSALTNRLNGIKKAEKFTWNEEIERDFIQLKGRSLKVGYKHSQTFGWRSVHLNHRLDQGEHCGSIITGAYDMADMIWCWRFGVFVIRVILEDCRNVE